jgi:hypothetical protein
MNYVKKSSILFFLFVSILTVNCTDSEQANGQNASDNVLGYGILSKITGLWHGPVSTSTPAGNFPVWYVDFRPVSAGQVTQHSLLDTNTINVISFFIVKHDNQLKVAMRTEGCFAHECCVTYEVVDSVDEEHGYYRFCDFIKGTERAYTEFTIKADEFLMEVYTNKFNELEDLELHSRWTANLGDRSAAREAIEHFDFPKPEMVKDFTDVFNNRDESIYYTFENDPYKSSEQPYTGNVTVNISISEELIVEGSHELFILLTTQSLFDGLKYIEGADKYYSRYVYLPIDARTYTLPNVHPGTYYVYTFNDINGDKRHLSGDWMSSDLENMITVPENGNVTVNSEIDFVIP